MLSSDIDLICRSVSPVVQEENAHIVVVVGCGRAIDDDATEDAFPSLESEMGMVPCATVLCCSPGIGD